MIQKPGFIKDQSDLNEDNIHLELEREKSKLDESFVHPPPSMPDDNFQHPAPSVISMPGLLHEQHGHYSIVPIENNNRKKKKKKCRLPWWFIYPGYVLAFCTVSVTFWASVEFAGPFGKTKALEWLMSFFVSFFESIFFSQPIKVGNYLIYSFFSNCKHTY